MWSGRLLLISIVLTGGLSYTVSHGPVETRILVNLLVDAEDRAPSSGLPSFKKDCM